jgi:hypothetical protein
MPKMASLWMSNKMGHLLRAFVKSVKKKRRGGLLLFFLSKIDFAAKDNHREFTQINSK